MRHVAVVAIVLSLLGVVLAQNAPDTGRVQSSALINEALDKQVNLELNGALPNVMDRIGKETGVRLEAQSAVWELLPWGQMTNVTATIKNQTLREALTALTRRLGLTFVLRPEAVELQPMPALRRLGHRSTLQELQALDLLASTPANLTDTRPSVKVLIEAVDLRLKDVDKEQRYAIENRVSDAIRMDQQVSVPRNSTLMDALESLPKETGATWYPWGKSIVIVTKKDQIRSQLAEKTVSARYQDVDVAKVLDELIVEDAGVNYSVEPGAFQRLPPDVRNIRLVLTNSTIKQALETISGFTGLGYVITDNGVYLWNAQQAAGPAGRLIGMIQIPDLGIMVPLRDNEVPPDIRDYIQSKTQKELDKWRAMMKEEGFRPTPPATKPANSDL